MSSQKVQRKTCDRCKILYPVTSMAEKTRNVRVGSSGGFSTGFGKKKNVRASVRVYDRKQKYWVCSDKRRCDDPEGYEAAIRIEEKRMAEERAVKRGLLFRYFEGRGKLSQSFYTDKKEILTSLTDIKKVDADLRGKQEKLKEDATSEWSSTKEKISSLFQEKARAELDDIDIEQFENLFSVTVPKNGREVFAGKLSSMEDEMLQKYIQDIENLPLKSTASHVYFSSEVSRDEMPSYADIKAAFSRTGTSSLIIFIPVIFLIVINALVISPVLAVLLLAGFVGYFLLRGPKPKRKWKPVLSAVDKFFDMEKSELDEVFENSSENWRSGKRDNLEMIGDLLHLTNTKMDNLAQQKSILDAIEKSPRKMYKKLFK